MIKHRLFFQIFVTCNLFMFSAVADRGAFDLERWDFVLNDIRTKATNQSISPSVIDETLKRPMFIPGIIKSDKNQKEFTLTLNEYLSRTVNTNRIAEGRQKKAKYPTLLNKIETKYGIPKNVILAFWGMESNYGQIKSRYKLTDSFITLIYDGRRADFFSKQLLSLMKTADKNKMHITDIHGSWAGAMGHFQFIPTTLAQYGIDGNYDGRIDIINNISDAMHSAGNYLNKLGWNKNEKIVRRVVLPADFDVSMLNGDVKKTLPEWSALGVTNPDGSPIPQTDMMAGLVADTKEIAKRDLFTTQPPIDSDIEVMPQPVIEAYLTYPNFYRIKKWNNSSWYAIAIAELADRLK